VTLYLFRMIRTLLDGRRFVCWADEFSRLLTDPSSEQFAKDFSLIGFGGPALVVNLTNGIDDSARSVELDVFRAIGHQDLSLHSKRE
jgi:type IV secretory pathway VirB4 component